MSRAMGKRLQNASVTLKKWQWLHIVEVLEENGECETCDSLASDIREQTRGKP